MATFVMGIPLSAVISPLIVAFGIVVMDLVNLAAPLRDPFRGYKGDTPTLQATAQYVGVAAALLVPGAVLLMVSWLFVRRLFRRSAAGSGVIVLGARDPRPGDLEERQLANVVAEMAAAAGIPPPKFKLLDSPVPNAGVVGTALDNATLVVTTGLLDTLDRDETQAVIGQLVGSAGNGDLRIGTTLMSVFITFGAVSAFLGAPGDRAARRSAWRLLRLPFRRRDPAFEASLVESLLADRPESAAETRAGCLSVVTLPFVTASAAFSLNQLVFTAFLVNPFLKRRWRERRYLADASAVELTRNPTALAEALTKLAPRQATIPGTQALAHLFIVSGDADPKRNLADLHAPIPKRLERLERLGSQVAAPAHPRPRLRDVRVREVFSSGAGCLAVLVLAVVIPFLALVVPIMWACALALVVISFAIDLMFLAPMVGVVHLLLRSVGR